MPLYEFECTACGQSFDTVKPIAKRDEGECCPSCGNQAQRKLATVAVLRGATPCGSDCAPRRSPLVDPPCCGGGGCPN